MNSVPGFRLSAPRLRGAFTLIELLIVIAVIATLAGLLIPAVSLVKTKANDLKCSNNLRQVATAFIAYQGEWNDEFPPSLRLLISAKGGMGLANLDRLLQCPRDRNKGKNSTMNRGGALNPILTELYETNSSYLYQCSSVELDASTFGWFFWGDAGRQASLTDVPAMTWADGKRNQQESGNCPGPTIATPHGAPFPPDLFPVISCFWHNQWTPANTKTDRKVVSVSFNGNVFWHIPFWEHEVNPLIPLP